MNVNAELSLDVFYYALIKTDNVIASSSSLIDEDKSLTVMHSGTSQRTSLPSALLYHPSCRNLNAGFTHIVMRHTGILHCQTLVNVASDNRIHKEAACIARNTRVRQLCLANLHDGLAQLAGCRHGNALCLKRGTDVAVVEVGSE